MNSPFIIAAFNPIAFIIHHYPLPSSRTQATTRSAYSTWWLIDLIDTRTGVEMIVRKRR